MPDVCVSSRHIQMYVCDKSHLDRARYMQRLRELCGLLVWDFEKNTDDVKLEWRERLHNEIVCYKRYDVDNTD